MRELKFRQLVNGRWHYFGFIDGSWIGPATPNIEKNPVVQYTGLHDRNGKEIYEGDIGSWWVGSRWGPCSVVGFGEMLDKDFDVIGTGWVTGKFRYGVDNKFVVCGNIYENPELLEDTT